MKRALAIALVVATTVGSTALAQQGADPLPPEDPPVAGSAAGSATTGSAPSVSGPGSGSPVAGSAAGSATTGSDPSVSGPGSGSAAGSAAGGSAGAGSGSAGAPKPIVIIIPPDVTPPDVSAAASPSVVRLGDKFILFITATYGADVEVNLREPIEIGGDLEVVRKSSENRKTADGKNVREWQLEVIAWDVGRFQVPPLAVTFTSQGKAGQVATNAVPLEVTGVLGDLVDDPKLMRGDAPPVPIMSRDWFWAWIAGGAGAVLVLAALIAFLWIRARRRRRPARSLIGALVVAAAPQARRLDMTSERAIQQLLAIEQSGVLDRDDDRKRGYAEMVEVIREYTGARYRVVTLDQTTAELMRALKKVAPADECAQIAHWLERCDIVKYGGLEATADDARGVLDGARTLVMTTTRAPGRASTSPADADRPSPEAA
jgi:hypothetical protein